MFALQKRTIASLILVLGGYLGYHLGVTPVIEPKLDIHDDPQLSPAQMEAIKLHADQRLNAYQRYFPSGSWERTDKPVVLDNEHSKLLFKEYHNLDNGKVELNPCSILFLPDGEPEDDMAPRRAIVLESPGGAILQFDRPVDLQRGKIGQLLGGNMNGPITITAPESRPGANDQLLVETRAIEMTTEKIWTKEQVTFKFGPNHGSGRELVIHLSPSASTSGKATNIGSMESLELLHEVQMRIVPGEKGLLPLDNKMSPTAATAGATGATPPTATTSTAVAQPSQPTAPQPPVDVRCQGPFRFDMLRYVATFEDRVDVVRSLPNGPSDVMNCERLSVFFNPKAKTPVGVSAPGATGASAGSSTSAPNTASSAGGESGKTKPAASDSGAAPAKGTSQKIPPLEPRRFEARGTPVIVRGDINGVFAQAERIDYDIVTRQLAMDGGREVTLRQNTNEIHARTVVYQPGEDGRLGWLSSQGPGWLRGIPQQPNSSGKDGSTPSLSTKPPVNQPSTPSHSGAADRPVMDLFATPGPNDPRRAVTPPSVFEAHWSKELKMRPSEQNEVISLLGDARAGLSGQGELAAEEIHLWLIETPVVDPAANQKNLATAPAAGPPNSPQAPRQQPSQQPSQPSTPTPAQTATQHWQTSPDRLLALNAVSIRSPQLMGHTDRLEAWFEQSPAAAPGATSAAGAAPQLGRPQPASAAGGLFGLGGGPASSAARPGQPFSATAANTASINAAAGNATAGSVAPRIQQYTIDGQRIRIQFLVRPSGAEVQDVDVDGRAQFAETQTAQPGDKPLNITGDRLQVTRANFPDTQVTVVGKPALVGARGLDMYGDVVRMDKGANRVWIDGPGRMKVPEAAPTSGQPSAQLKAVAPLSPGGLPLTGNLAGNLAGGKFAPGSNATGNASAGAAARSDSPPSEYLAPGDRGASVLRPQPAPDPMIITWQGRMNFDGSLARFEKSVVGKSTQRNFTTDTLDVTLRRRIDFNQPRMEDRAEIGRFVCHGETQLENRSADYTGLTAIDRMRARDLMVDEVSGAILGQGPGWLVSVRKGNPDPSQTQPGGQKSPAAPTTAGRAARPVSWVAPDGHLKVTPVADHPATAAAASPTAPLAGPLRSPAAASGAGPNATAKSGAKEHHKKSGRITDADQTLNYLHVEFQGAVSGNLNNHEITLHDQVRTIYGPVLSWQDQLDPDGVDDLGPGDVQMTCDALTVRDSASPGAAPIQGRRPIEMEAVGNTVVDVQAFTARCYRMTYAEDKDLLTFEGDGRNDAQLFRQERAGAPTSKTAARTIQFWRTANRIRVDGARVIDLNQIPTPD